ncbi:MAG TPA: biopolymer transporter ExbD [Anaeromyxobacter sp.]|nr:biopolymer transporter ExbD [Anaeromyxobacter sp.]
MTAGGKGGIKSEINVTPLVDVVLVLLIIFMVVTPMLQRGKDVQLPKSLYVDKDPKGGDPLILSVTKDGSIWVEKDKYTESTLEQRLKDEIIASPYRPFLLKGDTSITVGEVRKVMAIARKAGARGVRVAVEQLKTEGQG